MSPVSNREPIDSAFDKIVNGFLTQIHTAIPAQITSVDLDKQTVSVQPTIRFKYKNSENSELRPIISDVRMVTIGYGNFVICGEPKIGDYVLVLFTERAIGNWLSQGGIVDPESRRKFDLSDAVAIPTLRPDPDLVIGVESDCLSIRSLDNTVHLKIESDRITNRIGNTEHQISDGLIQSKPTIPLDGNIKVYRITNLPAPGYVGLADHTHTDSVGGPTSPPLTIPGIP